MNENTKDLGKLLRIFSRLHNNYIRLEFDKKGLGELSNPEILFIVGKHDPNFKKNMKDKASECCNQKIKITQKEIADIIGISAPTVAVSIKRMEKAGLLYRQSDEGDLRKNHLYLTEKGKKLVMQCREEENRILSEITNDFSEDEIMQLCDFYLRMIKNMKGSGAKIPKLM